MRQAKKRYHFLNGFEGKKFGGEKKYANAIIIISPKTTIDMFWNWKIC